MAYSFDLNLHIKDPIYGYVELTDLEKRIIETSVFQRLRFITQNGLAFYTFPALRGSRFEHSIGVCHLACRFMTAAIEHCEEDTLRKLSISFCSFLEKILSPNLYNNLMDHCHIRKENLSNLSRYELREIPNFMIQLLRLRGLLHDIGHLPFSHLGEEAVEPHLAKVLSDEDVKEYEELGCKFHEYIGYKIIMNAFGGLREAFLGKEGQLLYLEVLQAIYRKKGQLAGNNGVIIGVRSCNNISTLKPVTPLTSYPSIFLGSVVPAIQPTTDRTSLPAPAPCGGRGD